MTAGAVVPAYFHPRLAAGDWSRVLDLGRRWACVVVNVADGPGAVGAPPDAAYRGLIRALSAAGVRVAGYVDVDYGARAARLVRQDVLVWAGRYGVASVFLDRYPASRDEAVTASVAWVRARAGGLVVANPGVHPDADAVDGIDVCVTFEGPWDTYRGEPLPPPVPLPCAAAHLVHGAPPALARRLCSSGGHRGVACYATPASGPNPWRVLSPAVEPLGWCDADAAQTGTFRQTTRLRRLHRTTGGGAAR